MSIDQTVKKIWTDTYKIHSFDVNTKAHAGIAAICRFMQETAYNHAEHLGVGYTFLKTLDLVWILSSQKVKIDKFPVWGDEITVQTWPSSKDRLFYYRDFKIIDSKSIPIGVASTKWLLVSSITKRPQRPDTHFEFEIKHTEQVFTNGFERIDFPEQYDFKNSKKVNYSETDIYKHVNNTKYIEYLIDNMPAEHTDSYDMYELQIDYLNESRIGDSLTIKNFKTDDDTYLHSLYSDKINKPVCRARTKWKM